MSKGEVVALFVIANRNIKDELIKELTECKEMFFHTVYGKGSVKSNQFLQAFGFHVEQEKVLLIGLISRENSARAFDILIERFKFNKPNTGIAFSVPIDKLKY
ncbi:MAG: hypothetical protein LBS99_03380 [Clostridiales bacterium]|jgi:hypothetical protein|nr:hypothetical protein [Clostridiales bacterium]